MKNQASSKYQYINLSCFPDDLLLELFYRLPTFESILRCKSVCKNWSNLITKPEFQSRYITFRVNSHLCKRDDSDDELHPHVICFRRLNAPSFIYPGNSASFTCLDSQLHFIPAYQPHFDSLAIKSWCNDLVLCTSALPKELELYICNPRTRQYIQLPPPSNRDQWCLAGFTWDPYYTFDKHTGEVTLSSHCRYCVCYANFGFLFSPSSRLQVEIFSSETRVWRKAELRTPHSFTYSVVDSSNCFTYKGMLHFYDEDAIVGFDPYSIDTDGVIHGHYIEMPPYEPDASNRSVSIGVFGQQVLLVEYRSRLMYQEHEDITQLSVEQNTTYAITAWELKNYNTGEWSMKHMIYLHELVSEESIFNERIKRGYPYSCLLYIYQNDADILLLLNQGLIVECNMKTKMLKTVCQLTEYVPKVYGLAFQWWPSPLPLNL